MFGFDATLNSTVDGFAVLVAEQIERDYCILCLSFVAFLIRVVKSLVSICGKGGASAPILNFEVKLFCFVGIAWVSKLVTTFILHVGGVFVANFRN